MLKAFAHIQLRFIGIPTLKLGAQFIQIYY